MIGPVNPLLTADGFIIVNVLFPVILMLIFGKISGKSLFLQTLSKNTSCLENTDFRKVQTLFDLPRKILLTTHTNPDGDAIGSSLALYGYFRMKGHQVSVMVPDEYPTFLAWMPWHDEILVFSRDKEKCLQKINEADIIFSLDYNSLDRLQGCLRR